MNYHTDNFFGPRPPMGSGFSGDTAWQQRFFGSRQRQEERYSHDGSTGTAWAGQSHADKRSGYTARSVDANERITATATTQLAAAVEAARAVKEPITPAIKALKAVAKIDPIINIAAVASMAVIKSIATKGVQATMKAIETIEANSQLIAENNNFASVLQALVAYFCEIRA